MPSPVKLQWVAQFGEETRHAPLPVVFKMQYFNASDVCRHFQCLSQFVTLHYCHLFRDNDVMSTLSTWRGQIQQGQVRGTRKTFPASGTEGEGLASAAFKICLRCSWVSVCLHAPVQHIPLCLSDVHTRQRRTQHMLQGLRLKTHTGDCRLPESPPEQVEGAVGALGEARAWLPVAWCS